MKATKSIPTVLAIFSLAISSAAACERGERAGLVTIDGSSTVYPITAAVAEEYSLATDREARVIVGVSGTGGGMQRLCTGQIDVANASREIEPVERALCRENDIDPVEIPVAADGIAIVVNPTNDFVECLTVEELREVWRPGSTVETWSDIRPEWPDEPVHLYGPGTSSGTFDYFTETIMGEAGASRPDYTASEDDNVLVTGVAGDPSALGYFGYAFYAQNESRLEIVAVNGGDGCVLPTPETIETNTYEPLSRPLFIYVDRESLAEPEVLGFIDFYLNIAPTIVPQVGYVPLGAEGYAEIERRVERIAAQVTQRQADVPATD